jgi:hypothetical protein
MLLTNMKKIDKEKNPIRSSIMNEKERNQIWYIKKRKCYSNNISRFNKLLIDESFAE